MMTEMVNRRLKRGNLPDLFLVDGGKGHLMTVIKALKALSKEFRPDVIAIAKSHEGSSDKKDKIFLPGRKNPLLLENNNPVLLLLMRIRDEAHRRAISHHRKLRDKKMKASILDSIPGIGPKRKGLLLKQFGDINAIAVAKVDELKKIPGINNDLAKNILSFLK
jgi:excinuclease ABC subunit C